MKRSREPEENLDSDSDYDNAESRPVTKIPELELNPDDADERGRNPSTAMKCQLPPHRDAIPFNSYAEYETHYSKYHTNRCLECRKNFPSEHLLSVHIEECHDPLIIIRRDKGEHTFSCFVEGCERKCLTHQKRRMHMIDKHMYPKNYFFAITKEGIDGRRSLLVESGHRRRQSSSAGQSKESRRRESLKGTLEKQPPPSAKKDPKVEVSDSDEDDEEEGEQGGKPDAVMEDLTGAMSSLQFVPHSIRFGRQRAGFSKR